jgi:hypothetical protein
MCLSVCLSVPGLRFPCHLLQRRRGDGKRYKGGIDGLETAISVAVKTEGAVMT